MPNFVLLDTSRPDIAHLLIAMLRARQAVERRSWSHPQAATGEDWWADVLADRVPESEIIASTRRSSRQPIGFAMSRTRQSPSLAASVIGRLPTSEWS
jgi:hypothetical protein